MDQEKRTNFFSHNLDVFLGLLAWIVAASDQILPRPWKDSLGLTFLILGVPALWLFLNIMALRHRRRSAWRLWWIWTSAPVALTHFFYMGAWFLGGIIGPPRP